MPAGLTDRICTDPIYAGHVTHRGEEAGAAAQYAEPVPPLEDRVRKYCREKNLRLYTHQAAARSAVSEGRDVMLATPTASGKTLAYMIPVLEGLSTDPAACALLLFPTKALTRDQLTTATSLCSDIVPDAKPAVYDGDTPKSRRKEIRASSRMILSNPHELHHILSWHSLWQRFWKNIRYLVIDEAHRYRGVAGSHAALLFRRTLRVAALYGSHPRILLASATIGNPAPFARTLTGRDVSVISSSGAPAGPRSFLFYNPYTSPDEKDTTYRAAASLMKCCVAHDLQTLAFTNSRKGAETLASMAERHHSGKIPAYRAGYLPDDRRKLENGLKNGSFRGIVSTDALEVGIDIGGLDAVIMAGFPPTRNAAWQRSGRAGRTTRHALSVLVASENPLDQYYIHHPDAFFGRPAENVAISPENPYILAGHLLCAAAEFPLTDEDCTFWFGPSASGITEELVRGGALTRTGRGAVYSGSARPAEIVQISGTGGKQLKIVSDGKIIETIETGQAFREAHPGAVFLHAGDTYLISSFDPETGIIRADRSNVDFRTSVLSSGHPESAREEKATHTQGCRLSFGNVIISEHYPAYRVTRYGKPVMTEPLSLPPLTFATEAFWFTFTPEEMAALEGAGYDPAGTLHAIEHALIAMMPAAVLCDRQDLGGFSTLCAADTGMPTIMVYDGYEGGAGLAAAGYSDFAEIIRMTHDLITECTCESGCPSCIFSPKCGSMNQPLDKAGAAMLLGMMCIADGTKSPGDDAAEQITPLSYMRQPASGTP
ncbi:DEAD/DEAH box helicase [Methanogenium sp. S4BF]|uniref:DEAD/DEAH box helicase n=1 Tax=Methanogenium sp. S4BF TaxID=1789226 RepID=UPI0024179FBF|nr:DEAD/DEAH box helicase [Methanogenium sp. S4BF]WFN34353.1 DEAD/DEAH box helicase [Methanogenium sp. S4BF]